MKKIIAFILVFVVGSHASAGWQMSYTDDRDNSYANSYWIPAQINISPVDKIAYILFLGYKNNSNRSLAKSPIGLKSYVIRDVVDGNTGVNYWKKYFTPNKIEGSGKGPYINSYALSLEIKDNGLKDGYTYDGTNYKDGQGDIVTFSEANQSFFEVAVSTN